MACRRCPRQGVVDGDGDVSGLGEPWLAPTRFSLTELELLLRSISSSCSTAEAQTASAEPFCQNACLTSPYLALSRRLVFSMPTRWLMKFQEGSGDGLI